MVRMRGLDNRVIKMDLQAQLYNKLSVTSTRMKGEKNDAGLSAF